MMRFLKYAAMLIALIITALLAAPFVIDVNDYRAEISKQVEQATGRAFTIGAIHASLFPWIGLELNDVRMANASGFARPDFLRAKRLQIQVEVMPLLNREVVIRSFKLIDPQIFLEKNKRGEGNWQDLTGTSSAPASTPPSGGSKQAAAGDTTPSGLPALIAHAIILEGGHIGWRDAKGGGLDIDDITLTITDLQQLRPVKVALSATVGGNPFKLDANVGPLGDLGRLDPNRLPLQLHLVSDHIALATLKSLTGSLPAALGGNPVASVDLKLEQRPDGTRVTAGTLGLASDAPALFKALDANWKGALNRNNDIQLQRATISINQQRVVQLSGTITKLATRPRFHLRIQSDPLTRRWLAHYLPALDTLYAAHPDAWKQLQVGLLLRGSANRVALDDLQLVLNGETLQGEGDFRSGKHPRVRLTLAGRTLHLDPWLPKPKAAPSTPPTKPATPTGGATINPPQAAGGAEPDLRGFAPWQVDLRLTVDTLTLHKLDLSHFQVAIDGKQGRYRLDPLRFGLSGGRVKEVATFDINRYPLAWTESLTMNGVQVGPVLRHLADTDLLNGTLAMQTNLNGRGMVADKAASKLNGKGKLSIHDGSIKGFDIAGTLRNLTSFQQATGPKKTDFSTLSGSFTITNGVVDNRDLFMASPLFRLTGHGKVDLVAKQLDYHAKPKLVGTLIGQGDTLAVRKGLAIPVSIRGSFDNPKILPEIDPMTLINGVGTLLKRGAGGVGTLLKGAGQGTGKLIEGVTGGVGAGLGGAIGTLLGGQPPSTTPKGATIAPSHNRPATIAPRSNSPANQGALIAPKPQSRQPAAPSTRQQPLQRVLGDLLNGL